MWRRLGRTERKRSSKASSFGAEVAAAVVVVGGVDEAAAMRSRSSCTRLDRFAISSLRFTSLHFMPSMNSTFLTLYVCLCLSLSLFPPNFEMCL